MKTGVLVTVLIVSVMAVTAGISTLVVSSVISAAPTISSAMPASPVQLGNGGDVDVAMMPPEDPAANLAWALMRCTGPTDPELCALALNTIAALEESGTQVQLCAVWKLGKRPKAHCVELDPLRKPEATPEATEAKPEPEAKADAK